MGKGIIRAFLLGSLVAGAVAFTTLRASPQDQTRAAQAAVKLVQDSAAAGRSIKAGEYKQAELAVLAAASEANQAGDETLRNQLRMTAEALELLNETKLKLTILIENKINFETLSNIEADTYLASARRLKKYLEIVQEQGWDPALRAEVERGIGPVLVKAIEIGDGVAAHGVHSDVAAAFKSHAVQLLH